MRVRKKFIIDKFLKEYGEREVIDNDSRLTITRNSRHTVGIASRVGRIGDKFDFYDS